ncbi:MAG: toll/interleukin-1 receptor domain-containing protein [Planctomycetaceae bacterium]|nr:toll/interleukin-1 receptor domain-containing protein [Planctomycetaceae bacterium]
MKIVFHDPADEPTLQAAFAQAKSKVSGADKVNASPWQFDLFVSYSHQDKLEVDYLVKIIKEVRPSARVFLDRMELQPGAVWQQHLFEVIDQSRKVMAVFSPQYLASKVCLDEYNIAHFRHRESPDGVLEPIYLHTAPLPTYMKLVQFIDAREGDWSQLAKAAKQLAATL